jgi:short-subunit dehydrogenase
MEINGKLVVVTGASGGIGAAVAKEMAKKGASVVLLARRKAQLDQVAQEIALAGGRA